MSQFIIFTTKHYDKDFIKIDNDKNFSLLKNASQKYFLDYNSIYTINNFHNLCDETRDKLNKGIEIEETELYKKIKVLENEEIYIFYGNEYNDLDEIHDFHELIEDINKTLIENIPEIYIHYKKVC